jgi:hypothetical protein
MGFLVNWRVTIMFALRQQRDEIWHIELTASEKRPTASHFFHI